MVESGQLVTDFCVCGDSRGRVLVVPFQNVSLKGILVKFCPIFSAISGIGKIRKINTEQQN